MTADELQKALGELKITSRELATLLGVTRRCVDLWLTDERAVHPAAAAYVRLLCALPRHHRLDELARLRDW